MMKYCMNLLIIKNNLIRKDINNPHIIKDEILPEIEEKKIKSKKKINKINIIDDIISLDNLVPKNSDYLFSQKNIITNIINKYSDLNLISIDSKETGVTENNKILNKVKIDENIDKNLKEDKDNITEEISINI